MQEIYLGSWLNRFCRTDAGQDTRAIWVGSRLSSFCLDGQVEMIFSRCRLTLPLNFSVTETVSPNCHVVFVVADSWILVCNFRLLFQNLVRMRSLVAVVNDRDHV